MAENTSRERSGEFIRKLFEILMAHPEGMPAKDALEQLSSKVKLTPYEEGLYESTGTRRFEKIVRFSTVDCAKAGWLLKQKGTWYITDEGREAYKKYSNPGDLFREATRLYRAWKNGQKQEVAKNSSENPTVDDEKTAEEKSTVTFEEAEEQAWSEIEEYIRAFNPYDFQQLVADLIAAMGYHIAWIAPPGKDGGIDVIARTDPLGTKAPRIKIQVKRNSDRINTDGVRAFGALINDDDVGLYIAAGGFTKDAEDFARSQERRKITLINLEKFVALWIKNYSNLGDAARQRLPLRPIHFLALDA